MENQTTHKKDNAAFMLLSFFGILFVLDAHICSNLTPFTSVFPLDSFFMPMFIFISGYFFKIEKTKDAKSYGLYLAHIIIRLLIPFLLWVIFYWIIDVILNATGIYSLNVFDVDIPTFINNLFTYGKSFGYNDPSWFALSLFYVCIIYASLRFALKKIWFEPVILILFIAIGCVAVYFAQTDFNNNAWATLLLRLAFFMQFFELGICYKKYIDMYHSFYFSLVAIIISIILNYILIHASGNNIEFPRCMFMDSFNTNNPALPFISSLSGIIFWLSIAKLLTPILGKIRVINFISNNTYFIMSNHLGIKSMIYLLFLFFKNVGIKTFVKFNTKLYFSDPWYCYHPVGWINVLVFILTIVIVSALCFAFIKIRQPIEKIIQKKFIKVM